jgi:hypothetical protein
MNQAARGDLIVNIRHTLKTNGWEVDRWGNYKINRNERSYRVKLQKTSLRYEVKGGNRWVNILSDYFKNIEVVDEGIKIKGKIVK